VSVRILIGDCVERMRELPDNSVDSVVCDPPYHLTSIVKRFGSTTAAPINNRDEREGRNGPYHRASKGFMGQTWDGGDVAFQVDTWAEVLRVLKPGGHLVAFSGTRTYHRMAVAIEDAGFEVRDMIAWHYGSGFPKSHDISKAIDRAAGAEREVVGRYQPPNGSKWNLANDEARSEVGAVGHSSRAASLDITAPATDAAREWEGWGTALKPATEPMCLARKPLSEKSIAANVLKWGTGALNIDGCRIETNGEDLGDPARFDGLKAKSGEGWVRPHHSSPIVDERQHEAMARASQQGRWPANLCHDGSDEVVAGFPDQESGGGDKRGGCEYFMGGDKRTEPTNHERERGSAARFFYCAKATAEDRKEYNNHPTVKPIALMRWLVRLVTPKGGTVLDPFMGSGSTLIAADAEQFNAIGCELSPEYAAIAERRIRDAAGMFADVAIADRDPAPLPLFGTA
jgi:DNA modification methylase